MFALAASIVVSAGWALWQRHGADFSTAGFAVSLAAIPVMSTLTRREIALADQPGSRALRADAIQSITCGWLSLVLVVSLGTQAATGIWWVDPLGSLAIVWLLVREGREARGGAACGCG